MSMQFSVAGITFRMKENPELKLARPTGAVTIVPDPNNPHDKLALKVMWNDTNIGFVPADKAGVTTQAKIHKYLSDGTPFAARINSYVYRDKGGWNHEHEGSLGAVKIDLCAEGDEEGDIIAMDGVLYDRVTSVLSNFTQGGAKFLIRWALNNFGDFEDYETFMHDAASKGTAMHDALELYFRDHDLNDQQVEHLPKKLQLMCDTYAIEPISMEERLFDTELAVSGRYDMRCMWDGVEAIVDWKSSKAIRITHKIQSCWYAHQAGLSRAVVVAFGGKSGLSVWIGDDDTVERGYQAFRHIRALSTLVL